MGHIGTLVNRDCFAAWLIVCWKCPAAWLMNELQVPDIVSITLCLGGGEVGSNMKKGS